MLWRDEAVKQVQALRQRALTDQPTESVSQEAISRRVIAGDIVAEQDLPSQDYATMDGYTFDADADYPLSVVAEEVFPESEPPRLAEGEAARIATGAPLPEGANAVLKREKASVEDGELSGPQISPGRYVYEQGNNVASGERLFEGGERLSPKDAILLGDLGRDTVDVREPFSTGILATGTEIHEGRNRDLDSAMLTGLIKSWGHSAYYEGTVPDNYDEVHNRIDALATKFDVVVTRGGTSVGKKDYVIRVLEELGDILFHRVRLRPGKPIAVAQLPDAIVFAIPGKPVGAHTIASLVMGPFFTGNSTVPTFEATLKAGVDLGPDGFEYAVPVSIDGDTVMPLGHADSPLQVYERTFDPSVISSSTRVTRADGFVLTQSALEEGGDVDVTPYPVVE